MEKLWLKFKVSSTSGSTKCTKIALFLLHTFFLTPGQRHIINVNILKIIPYLENYHLKISSNVQVYYLQIFVFELVPTKTQIDDFVVKN